jgi:hypothetical protein
MTLYAVHIQGPDDIIAAPGEREAEALAKKLNAFFTSLESGPAAPTVEAGTNHANPSKPDRYSSSGACSWNVYGCVC